MQKPGENTAGVNVLQVSLDTGAICWRKPASCTTVSHVVGTFAAEFFAPPRETPCINIAKKMSNEIFQNCFSYLVCRVWPDSTEKRTSTTTTAGTMAAVLSATSKAPRRECLPILLQSPQLLYVVITLWIRCLLWTSVL